MYPNIPRASRSVENLARDPIGEKMFTNSRLQMIKLNDEDIQFKNHTSRSFLETGLPRWRIGLAKIFTDTLQNCFWP